MLRITQNPRNDRFILEVIWLLPISECVKLNIDGCSKGNPGRSGFEGILRDSSGVVLGSFLGPIPVGTNYLAELNTFIYCAEYVVRKCFIDVWIECDSFGIILAIRSGLLPWCIQTRWKNVIASLNKFSWKISHMYKQANTATDKMAKIGCHMTSYQEWDTYPNSFRYHISWDAAGKPIYKFK
ncbi:hypothetical protein AMTRI_Chr06g170200 [Amborella trichopoda]